MELHQLFFLVCFSLRLRIRPWRVASSDEFQRLAGAQAALHRALRLKNPGGLVDDFWRNRCLRHTCVVFWPGELSPSQPRKRLFHEGLQRGGVPPASSGSVSDSRWALSRFRPSSRRTHGRGPAGLRLHFSRDRRDVSSWRCAV